MDFLPDIDVKKLIRYWRNTLADEDLMSLSGKDCVASVRPEHIQEGRLDEKTVKQLQIAWDTYKEKATWNQTEADIDSLSNETIPIIILGKGYAPVHLHGKIVGNKKKNQSYYTLHIAAFLSPTGELSIDVSSTPWIGRDYLSPNVEAEEDIPIVGELSTFDDWVSENPFEESSWENSIHWCESLCEKVIGDFVPEGFVPLEGMRLNIAKSIKNAGRNICQLYDSLEKVDEVPKLLQNLCKGKERKKEVDDAFRLSQIGSIRGTMSTAYGLAEKQSDAVSAYTAMSHGEILAVNGPPGTGKTTLLQSIIASEVVSAALRGEEPVVIVGSSIGNQAILNINKGMNDIFQENPAASLFPWARRWVPDADTYGLYLPTKGRLSEAQEKGYAYAFMDENKVWTGFPEKENSLEYIDSAQTQWIQGFSECFAFAPESIEAGLDRLRLDLKEAHSETEKVKRVIDDYESISLWWSNNDKDLSPQEYLKQVDLSLTENIEKLVKRYEEKQVALNEVKCEENDSKNRVSKNKENSISAQKKREELKRKLISIKSKVLSAVTPQGLIELISENISIFRTYSINRKMARLCELTASDELISQIFEAQINQNDPGAWVCRIDTAISDHNDTSNNLLRNEAFEEEILLKELEEAANNVAMANKLAKKANNEVIQANEKKESTIRQIKEKIEELNRCKQGLLTAYSDLREKASSFFKIHSGALKKPSGLPSIKAFNQLLDVTYRHMAFQKAMRYWEGRWILEAQRIQEGQVNIKSGLVGMEARFRRWCMLTPCLIVTAHSMPKHFRHKKTNKNGDWISTFMLDFIDLLIVDESGQIPPHVGASSFSLAKRAVVVGDIYQLEPVSNVAKGTDQANANRLGLSELWKDDEPKFPHLVSQPGDRSPMGSVMRLAQAATFSVSPDTDDEPGIFLTEHRRCRKEIIEYCNKLIYKKRLVPKTPPREKEPPIVPIAWAHVRGEDKKVGGSRKNELEAESIAGWIQQNAEAWCNHYDVESVDEVVAVITPFKPQAKLIKDKLTLLNKSFKPVTVGTVHSLQGDEKPIVIFSPTYNADTTRGVFFDYKPNMLNVAVSRAKDSFVIIGDMRLFRKPGKTPSSLLGEFLFVDEENELTDVDGNYRFPKYWLTTSNAERISNLNRHREVLRNSLLSCSKGQVVLIASPWITLNAINDDSLVSLVERAVKENQASVWVIVDRELSVMNSKHRAKDAMSQLKKAGATVYMVEKIHSKTLIFDSLEIVEGSFNWLSAQRMKDGRFTRHEVSWRISGAKAKQGIKLAIEEFQRFGVMVNIPSIDSP